MRTLFLITALVMYVSVNAQYYFVGGGYSPKPCFETDSIILLDTVELEVPDYRMDAFSSLHDDTLLLHICYRKASGPLASKNVFEKTKIGKLAKGKYIVRMDGIYNHIDSNCFVGYPLLNKLSFKMEVLAAPNGISEQTLSPSYLQSALIQNQLIIQGLPAHSSILVYDMQGRHCYHKENESGEASMDASGWSSGIYIVSVQVGNERRRWRVIKE